MDVLRDQAAVWASWFRALGDPSRIVILNLLATAGREMTVGEIVERVGLAQSTGLIISRFSATSDSSWSSATAPAADGGSTNDV